MSFETAWKFVTGLFTQMQSWDFFVLLFVALMVICHGLVCSKTFPNTWIWLVVFGIGCAAFSIGGDSSAVTAKGNPQIILGMYGIIVAAAAVFLHAGFYRIAKNRFPQWFNISEDDDDHPCNQPPIPPTNPIELPPKS